MSKGGGADSALRAAKIRENESPHMKTPFLLTAILFATVASGALAADEPAKEGCKMMKKEPAPEPACCCAKMMAKEAASAKRRTWPRSSRR